MSEACVHGYQPRENERLQDQAVTLVDILHFDTSYPPGSRVLEAGCGVGAQTITLAQRRPAARFTSMDVSAASVSQAKRRVDLAGISNVEFHQADVFALPYAEASFDHVFVCFVDAGVRDLHRTTGADGVFFYTFFKDVGAKA